MVSDANKKTTSAESIEEPKSEGRSFSNINIEAAYIHIISDIILSVGVMLSAFIIYFLAPTEEWSFWQLVDPFCTYFFSFMAIYTTIPIAKESIIYLMDGSQKVELVREIQNYLNEHSLITEVNNLKIWENNREDRYAAIVVTATDPQRAYAEIKEFLQPYELYAFL